MGRAVIMRFFDYKKQYPNYGVTIGIMVYS